MLGLLGKKLGMTQIFDKDGKVVPVTVIQAGPCPVLQRKTVQSDGYDAVRLGFGSGKKTGKPLSGLMAKAKVEKAPKTLGEIRIDPKDEVNVGQELTVAIFKEGDSVTITGTSKGKGFAGTVKRHHFNRGPMTHGSKSHRIPGSSGAGSSPGRVLPGTRRAGRMGNLGVTIKKIAVVRVDAEKNLLLVKGPVPGADNGLLSISKAG